MQAFTQSLCYRKYVKQYRVCFITKARKHSLPCDLPQVGVRRDRDIPFGRKLTKSEMQANLFKN